jgi:hypothetical protein
VKCKPKLVGRIMNEVIDYGGEQFTRAAAVRRLYKAGRSTEHANPRLLVDRWLLGYDQRQERRRCKTKR